MSRRRGDGVLERLLGPVVAGLVKIIYHTSRFEFEGLEHYQRVLDSGRPALFAFWHQDLVHIALAYRYFRRRRRPVAIMISRSRDGEKLARVIERLELTAVRASSSRGAVQGLMQMQRWLTQPAPGEHWAAMALDGPRGPRHQAKPGATLLARKCGALVIPVSFESTRKVVFKSWDRTCLPLPFGRVRVRFAPPIEPQSWGLDEQANAQTLTQVLLEHGREKNA